MMTDTVDEGGKCKFKVNNYKNSVFLLLDCLSCPAKHINGVVTFLLKNVKYSKSSR